MIEAGTGVVVITPNLGAPLAGSFAQRRAETIERDLTVRALVIANEATTIALVLCDLVCLPAWIVQEARRIASAATGIPAGNILVSATHTHYAPSPTTLLSTAPAEDYLAGVPRRIADSIAIAWRNRCPARIAHGAADTQDVCFNRRYRMRDGTVRFNPGVGNPDIIEPCGPIDPQVAALLVEDFEGRAIALWACLSLHYVGVGNEFAISPDYFGDFADCASRWLGDQCVGFLTNGTSGQINNIDVRPHDPVPAAAQRWRVANAVAAAAVQATLLKPRSEEVALRSRILPISIERREVTSDDVNLAEKILEMPDGAVLPAEQFSYVVGQPIPENQLRQYASEVVELSTWPESIDSELQAIAIGEMAIVALPGEMFVEFGLALKAASPFETTTVVSLSNDYVGYIPTIAAFSEGAYETWAAKSAWAAPGTGEAMVDAMVRHWNESAER